MNDMKFVSNFYSFLHERKDYSNLNLEGVPNEVIETSQEILLDNFTKVKKLTFEHTTKMGLYLSFYADETDFKFACNDMILKLDVNNAAMKRRNYDITLVFFRKISETYKIYFLIEYKRFKNERTNIPDKEDVFVDEFEEDEKIQKKEYKTISKNKDEILNDLNNFFEPKSDIMDDDF